MSVETKEHPCFCRRQEGLIGYACTCLSVCVCVFSCVDSSSIACSWITFLPVCRMLFPSCTGLDFLLWELGLFEEAHWARSQEGCQDQPWLTNTSKGSKLTEPNISSITAQTLWRLYSQGSEAPNPKSSQWRLLAAQRNGAHVSTCIKHFVGQHTCDGTHLQTRCTCTHIKGGKVTTTGVQTAPHTSFPCSVIGRDVGKE